LKGQKILLLKLCRRQVADGCTEPLPIVSDLQNTKTNIEMKSGKGSACDMRNPKKLYPLS